MLDVSPIGTRERDDIGGPTWAVRRLNPKNRDPLPAMNLGNKPVVTPECRVVMEQADLGKVDFDRIEVLDIGS